MPKFFSSLHIAGTFNPALQKVPAVRKPRDFFWADPFIRKDLIKTNFNANSWWGRKTIIISVTESTLISIFYACLFVIFKQVWSILVFIILYFIILLKPVFLIVHTKTLFGITHCRDFLPRGIKSHCFLNCRLLGLQSFEVLHCFSKYALKICIFWICLQKFIFNSLLHILSRFLV